MHSLVCKRCHQSYRVLGCDGRPHGHLQEICPFCGSVDLAYQYSEIEWGWLDWSWWLAIGSLVVVAICSGIAGWWLTDGRHGQPP